MNRRPLLAWLLIILVVTATALVPAASALAEGADAPQEVEFSGAIHQAPAAPGEPWNIAGLTIATNAQTIVRPSSGQPEAGMWAEVNARLQADGSYLASQIDVLPPEVQLRGPIIAKPDNPTGIGAWNIAGQTINVTADTRLNGRGARSTLDVGNWAETFAREEPAGVLTAVRMRGLDPAEQQSVEVFGVIQSFSPESWRLSGIPLAVDEMTTIQGEPKVGLLAQVAAQWQADTVTLLAERIVVLGAAPGQSQRPIRFTGLVEELPASPDLNGLWRVDGRQVEVTADTLVHQERGPATVGDQVYVFGEQSGDLVKASQIVVLRGPAWSENYVRITGPIRVLPETGLLGAWQVANQPFTVAETSRIEGGSQAQVGALAEVGALRQADETLVAAWVRVRAKKDRPDTPDPLAGRYIVVFKEGAGPNAVDAMMNGLSGKVLHRYQSALHGFAVSLPPQALEAIQRNPLVDYVEADQRMQAVGSQINATWGLDRIDQRSAARDGIYNYNQTGAGVRAYIIDTGILYNHQEFGGRASFGYDAFGGSGSDCNGHGTHVAGTVGGAAYGVAKNVSLIAVRVLDCNGSGTTSGVIAGVDYVTNQKKNNPNIPMVANMSLGGGASSSLDTAVRNSIASGVSYVVAAGNGDAYGNQVDACTVSPARVTEAMTIGATNSNDTKASWSNYGNCVDWFAPGVNITSAWYTSNTAVATISGTSMATPHTAGVAALYLEANPGSSPLTVRNALYDLTTKGIVTSSSTANNHLLYSMIGSGGSVNKPPTAAFTFSCTNLSCTFNGSGSSDTDGSITSYAWNFGDGSTGSGVTVSHAYAASGSYNISLTVTDDKSATGSTAQIVSVSSGATGGITLSARGRKTQGIAYADLTWRGATGANVDVFRNGVKIITTPNDGAHTDAIGRGASGTYRYKVCEAGANICSNEISLAF